MPNLTSNEIKEDRLETLKSLKLIYNNAKGTHLEKSVKDLANKYYRSTEISDTTVDGLVELQNIVSNELQISSPLVAERILSLLFLITSSIIVNRKDYTEKQKGEVIIRLILFLVGTENERLVKILSEEFETYVKWR